MDSVAWTAGSEPVVGVVDTDADSSGGQRETRVPDDLGDLLTEYDGSVVTGSVETVRAATPSFVVTLGDDSLFELIQATDFSEGPILPVDCDPGIASVSRTALPDAIRAVLDGDALVHERPVLDVNIGNGSPQRALYDVTLATDEPARISEYGVESRSKSIAQFRADGVVVATAAGSHGYANAVDGPILSSAVDAIVAAPIAPFDTHTDRWVLPDERLSLSIERNEDAVAVSVDGRTLETISADRRVEITSNGSFSMLVLSGENAFEN
ncbi:NAD(+)/NADH kinase [Halostagnicola sp. A-GB9-2]|uniref:NAD(+)/NADH kinase n=1 Tax=Halostagnicola sp. A-GB9-2 TaxID=3048066 RepID=UPI0024BF3450|nr:NAD(+)/NADH kinase [Halostagnicola sp. A-GB9-2]MDJ1430747.1 NAD(+)/NADH kinase [Halostagnicola sp. A-GB9-2]